MKSIENHNCTNGDGLDSLQISTNDDIDPSMGSLKVTILSAYDLPAPEHPMGVELSCLGQSTMTDAPSARHKDRNSFKFPSNQILTLNAPLPELYKTHATLSVKYRVKPEHNLIANIPLNSLKIQETTWLVVNLTETTNNDNNKIGENEFDDVPSTLRIRVRLEGPYRPEIGFLMAVGSTWFNIVDSVSSTLSKATSHVPSVDSRIFLIPAVPIATGIVVASPIILGFMILFLPFMLPIIVFFTLLFLGISGLGVALYASTHTGRSWLADLISPFLGTLLSNPSGQRLVYETGSRPTPVSVAKAVLPRRWHFKLFTSLFIDLIGSSSYLLPLVGEIFDLGWAPLQTILIMAMYNDVSTNLKYLSFIEEILPFTDIVPSATLGWFKEYGIPMLIGITAGVANPASPRPSPSNLAATNTNTLLQQKFK